MAHEQIEERPALAGVSQLEAGSEHAGRRRCWSAGVKGVSGHEKLPVGGHEDSPVAATRVPHWWPPDLPRYMSAARLAWAGWAPLLGSLRVTTRRRPEEGLVKSYGEIMNILEAFDLTGSYRAAAELARMRPQDRQDLRRAT